MTTFTHGYYASYSGETGAYRIDGYGGANPFTVTDFSGDGIAGLGESLTVTNLAAGQAVSYIGSGSGGIIVAYGAQYIYLGYSATLAQTAITDFQALPYDLNTGASVPCFLSGTLILTDRGEVPVEALEEGDLLCTLSGALKPLRWIGHRVVSERRAQMQPEKFLPFRILEGALGHDLPKRDLWLSPHHCLYHDGVLVEAKALGNGCSVIQAHPGRQIVYYHLLLDAHDVIFAEGTTAETYRPGNNTSGFQNSETFPDDIARNQPVSQSCFPLTASGPKVAALQALLLANAPAGETEAPRAA